MTACHWAGSLSYVCLLAQLILAQLQLSAETAYYDCVRLPSETSLFTAVYITT